MQLQEGGEGLMAKIRGVKPDMWTDENFVELSPYARLLWVGLWNYACDNGHVQDKSKQIKMRILPTDEINCAALLREIETQQMIARADGWITIHNLTHHQKPHKSWWTTCEKPGCVLPEGTSHAPKNRKDASAAPKAEPKTTVAQPLHNGEQLVHNGGATADGDCDGEGDGEGELMVTNTLAAPANAVAVTVHARFNEFWDAYSKKRGKGAAEKAFTKAARKADPSEIIRAAHVHADYHQIKRTEFKFIPYPATWLNESRWGDDLDQDEQGPTTRLDGFRDVHEELVRRQQSKQSDVRQIGGSR